MIEWQSESGALIVRIHGKQWYWVYKYDLSNVLSVLNTPKNIGFNKWVSSFKDGKNVNDRYLQAAQIKIRQGAQQEYWGEVASKEFNLTSNFKTAEASQTVACDLNKNNLYGLKELVYQDSWEGDLYPAASEESAHIIDEQPDVVNVNTGELEQPASKGLVKTPWSGVLKPVAYLPGQPFLNLNVNSLYFYENVAIEDDWEVYSNTRASEFSKPVSFTPSVLNQHFYDLTNDKSLILLKFHDDNLSVVEKPEENIDYVVVKQKRYKRKQGIGAYWVDVVDSNAEGVVVKKTPNRNATGRFLQNNQIIHQITATGGRNSFDFYSSVRLGRSRSEMFSVNLARRLLRTTRTLVLPAYTNISIIANSYDVVHSWFIPGLGLKIDCVPGKSTHHSLYIDNVGLYYGQCAEICGRYHHHMPIRVCALPFEHFIIWWTSKGMPKALRMKYNAKVVDETLFKKYSW